jgi:hypothetical protein
MTAILKIDREAEWRRIERDVAALTPDPELAARIFRGVRHICARQWQRSPNWVVAMELYGTGSTYAHAICRRIGIDPDARSATPLPDTHPQTAGGKDGR